MWVLIFDFPLICPFETTALISFSAKKTSEYPLCAKLSPPVIKPKGEGQKERKKKVKRVFRRTSPLDASLRTEGGFPPVTSQASEVGEPPIPWTTWQTQESRPGPSAPLLKALHLQPRGFLLELPASPFCSPQNLLVEKDSAVEKGDRKNALWSNSKRSLEGGSLCLYEVQIQCLNLSKHPWVAEQLQWPSCAPVSYTQNRNHSGFLPRSQRDILMLRDMV